jgi:arylsulfatase A-like enzyme
MVQTRKAVGAKGTTATQWRIHTPICAASRSELLSGRYFHNIKSKYSTPGAVVSSGAIHHVDLENKVWPFVFPRTLREKKGYRTGLFGKVHERQLWSQHDMRPARNVEPAQDGRLRSMV